MRTFIFLFLLIITLDARAAPRKPAFSLLPRKEINTKILGTNAFCNKVGFGTPASELNEVKNVTRLKYVRVLFLWDDTTQPTPASPLNFSFFDDIASHIPKGVTAFAVLTGVPSWMNNPDNWIDGNPRKTFNEMWVKKVVRRYRKNKRLAGFQIWNEPNDNNNPHNVIMGLSRSPKNYVELLSFAWSSVKRVSRSKKVISAATTAINQNFPRSVNYNRSMRNAGAEKYCDVWGVHYYSEQIENVLRPRGFRSFSHGLKRPIWITESGAKGTTRQLAYGQRVWPFLTQYVHGIARIYQYQFSEDTPADSTYGMKNLTPGRELSDLFIFLRDRK